MANENKTIMKLLNWLKKSLTKAVNISDNIDSLCLVQNKGTFS